MRVNRPGAISTGAPAAIAVPVATAGRVIAGLAATEAPARKGRAVLRTVDRAAIVRRARRTAPLVVRRRPGKVVRAMIAARAGILQDQQVKVRAAIAVLRDGPMNVGQNGRPISVRRFHAPRKS